MIFASLRSEGRIHVNRIPIHGRSRYTPVSVRTVMLVVLRSVAVRIGKLRLTRCCWRRQLHLSVGLIIVVRSVPQTQLFMLPNLRGQRLPRVFLVQLDLVVEAYPQYGGHHTENVDHRYVIP